MTLFVVCYLNCNKLLFCNFRREQVSVNLVKDAELAINDVIAKLPKDLVQEAQQFRATRAAAAKAG
jgi:hypothetical protein